MVISCFKCHHPAITFIRYNGTHLCDTHLIEFIEKRVKKDIRKQGTIPKNAHLGVALSGGKDSTVALHLTKKIFKKRPNIQISAFSIDEGIQGYRDESLQIAAENCKELKIPHYIVNFKDELNWTMDDIAKLKDELGECSYCGVFRRFCLNQITKDHNITRLITGHNLDDMAQSILMNLVNNDLQKLARLGPHLRIQPGLVPRMLPLRMIPEKEIMLYALLKNISFHSGECPYAFRAARGQFRDIIENLENTNPGTRHSILNSYSGLRDCLMDKYPAGILQSCEICGEPSSQRLCKTCVLKKRLHS